MSKKYLFVFAIFFSLNIFADEGMWEPYQMELLQKELRASGYKGNVSNVSDLFKHPMSARLNSYKLSLYRGFIFTI